MKGRESQAERQQKNRDLCDNRVVKLRWALMHNYKVNGFTLIELMVTVLIAAVLGALAAPSLRDFLMRQRMTGIVDDFNSSVMRARNEATGKNVCTTMCMSSTTANANPTCATAGTDWQRGWIAFINASCDGSINTPVQSSDVFLVRESVGDEYLLQTQQNIRKISFNPLGNSTLNNSGSFDLIYNDVSSAETKKYGVNVCLDVMGRTRKITNDKNCSNF